MAAEPSDVSATPPRSIIGVLAEGGCYPLIKVIDEDIGQARAQHRPLGNTASHRSPNGLCMAHHHPLSSASQPVHNSLHRPLIYPALYWLRYQDVTGDSIKSLAEVKVDNIHCSPPIFPASDTITEGCEVGQA